MMIKLSFLLTILISFLFSDDNISSKTRLTLTYEDMVEYSSATLQKDLDDNECSIQIDAPDKDRDGVEDNIDQCPNTPCNMALDETGCQIKSEFQIYFRTNSAVMGEVSTQKVKNIAKLLLKNYTTHVKIIGYSDTVETSKYNESLSILRGEVLKIALINLGIEEYRLTSYIGTNTKEQLEEIRKIVKNQKEWLAVNRRVEIEISYPND